MSGILHFDAFSGLSGDMILGALLDIVNDNHWFLEELKKLNLNDYQVNIAEKKVKGIKALKVDITYTDQKKHRHLSHINEIIEKSSLADKVKETAKAIFFNLAQAEAKVHNTEIEKVHFHEVGAIDAIIDITGAAILIDKIAAEKVTCSSLPLGKGFVKCDHGLMPVPAPATAELLKGVPVYDSGAEGELVTPTGAAIVKTICSEFIDLPTMTMDKVGYGSGTIERDIPNLLRVFTGEPAKKKRVVL